VRTCACLSAGIVDDAVHVAARRWCAACHDEDAHLAAVTAMLIVSSRATRRQDDVGILAQCGVKRVGEARLWMRLALADRQLLRVNELDGSSIVRM